MAPKTIRYMLKVVKTVEEWVPVTARNAKEAVLEVSRYPNVISIPLIKTEYEYEQDMLKMDSEPVYYTSGE